MRKKKCVIGPEIQGVTDAGTTCTRQNAGIGRWKFQYLTHFAGRMVFRSNGITGLAARCGKQEYRKQKSGECFD